MKFELKNTDKFGWEGLNGWAYNSSEDFKNASAAYFEVTSKHGKVKTTKSDRIYFIAEGQGEFTIDNKSFSVKKTDVVIVPKNTPYDYKAIDGVMNLFLVHAPAYDPEAEEKLE